MTISDISNILVIMEEMSINKAAARLFLSQPALSKCVRKVEQEYNISLFMRSKGSPLVLTEAGMRFREMGMEVMKHHDLFTYQLDRLKNRSKTNIVFATTIQRAYDMSSPVMKWIYNQYPGYNVEVRTLPSREIIQNVVAGDVDIALLPNPEENTRLTMTVVLENDTYIYLRKGSPAAKWAQHVEGRPFPVLSLRHLDGESIVENIPGTAGRKVNEQIIKKGGSHLTVLEQPIHSLRITMVDAGHASMLISQDTISRLQEIDRSRIFCLPEEETVHSHNCLICRKEFQSDKRFSIMLEAVLAYYQIRS